MATLRKIFFFIASMTDDFFSPSHLKNFHRFGETEILSDGIFYWRSSYRTQILQETLMIMLFSLSFEKVFSPLVLQTGMVNTTFKETHIYQGTCLPCWLFH